MAYWAEVAKNGWHAPRRVRDWLPHLALAVLLLVVLSVSQGEVTVEAIVVFAFFAGWACCVLIGPFLSAPGRVLKIERENARKKDGEIVQLRVSINQLERSREARAAVLAQRREGLEVVHRLERLRGQYKRAKDEDLPLDTYRRFIEPWLRGVEDDLRERGFESHADDFARRNRELTTISDGDAMLFELRAASDTLYDWLAGGNIGP